MWNIYSTGKGKEMWAMKSLVQFVQLHKESFIYILEILPGFFSKLSSLYYVPYLKSSLHNIINEISAIK